MDIMHNAPYPGEILKEYEECFTGSLNDLRRIIASHEVVESLGGLGELKDKYDELPEDIKQAVKDVEACRAGTMLELR